MVVPEGTTINLVVSLSGMDLLFVIYSTRATDTCITVFYSSRAYCLGLELFKSEDCSSNGGTIEVRLWLFR